MPFIFIGLQFLAQAQTPAPVLTGQYNVFRTSANIKETILTPAKVGSGTFGLRFALPVDQSIFAQPLYAPGLNINGKLHNVVFAATLNNSVFAFDADLKQAALWHTNLGTPAIVGFYTLPKAGILSTPAIDPSASTMFVVTLTEESSAPVYRLHALNILTGAEMANILIHGAVPGTGDDSQKTPCTSSSGSEIPPPCIPFKAAELLQRPALLESGGTIYVAFGTLSGEESTASYHGWLLTYTYSGGAFTQTAIFNSTQNATQTGEPCSHSTPPSNQCGHGGGIWMSGRGPAMDGTGVYVVTGNGGFGGAGTGNWGESILRVDGSGVEDSFTPPNYAALNAADLDLGDAGPILFNSSNGNAPNLILSAGKTGAVYVANRTNLGGFKRSTPIQSFTATSKGCGTGPGQTGCFEVHSPAFWGRTSSDSVLYVWGYGDVLRAWDFDASSNQFHADAHQGTVTAANYPGGGLAVSSNGDNDGIVWAILPITDASNTQGLGALYAFDASNVATPLWVSTDYWYATRFTIPTVANGKVYVPSSVSASGATPKYSPELRVYGLVPRQ